MNTFKKFWRFLKGLGTTQKWVAVVAAIIIVGGVGYALFGPQSGTEDGEITTGPRTVTLLPVVDFAQNQSRTTSGAGSETVVRAEASGKVINVLPVGTRVSKGVTIALFENAGQRAALLQAEGALEAAEASLEKTQSGLRSEKIALLETALESSKNSTVVTLLSAYGSVDSAVRDTADQVFSNPESNSPKIIFASSDNQRKTQLENTRVLLGTILDRQNTAGGTLTNQSNLDAEMNTTEAELREVRSFMDDLITALNEAIPTGSVTSANIATYKANATAARTALTSALSAVASSRGALATAEKNLEEGLAGAEDTDLAAAAASVKQAQGAYNAALAAYQKTIVASSANGTILSCSAEVGDVITVGSDVCRIKTASSSPDDAFILPLASVKYTPGGAFVFIVKEDGTLEGVAVETSLVAAGGITVTGLFGDEFIVSDVRGLKTGEVVTIQ